MIQPSLLSVFATLLLAASTTHAQDSVEAEFRGQGHVLVLNNNIIEKASPRDTIGCLNARGVLTLNDCAVFTRNEEWPHELTSSEGLCTFRDTSTAENLASVYGRNSFAFSCGNRTLRPPMWAGEPWYTVNGFNYPYICNGNLNCFYDIERAPTNRSDSLPVWQFFWGSQQMDITPGHVKVMWLWDRVVDMTENAVGASSSEGRRTRSAKFRRGV